MEKQVLYEDNHIIIINKNPGEIVQGDKTGDTPLSDKVKVFLKTKYKKPGNVFLGVVHRLDRPVSGIVIFAKTSKSLSRLNKMLKDKNIQKTYYAVCASPPKPESGTLKNQLVRNHKQNKSYVTKTNLKNAKEAILNYELISSSKSFYLVKINLITGRHHQIRAQLSHIGCPIKGDLKYNFPRSNPNAGIDLHAVKVKFSHPVSGKEIIVTAPLPKNSVWKHFNIK